MWLCDIEMILPDRVMQGAIQIENGRIVQITDQPAPEAPALSGYRVMPGFIDMHGDMIEQELEPRPGVDFPMQVALRALDARLAAAGVTTAYASVSFSRGAKDGGRRSFAHTSQVIKDLAAIRDEARVDHKIHVRFDITFENSTGVLRDLLDLGHADLVSMMDHTPGQGQYRDLEKHIRARASLHDVTMDKAREMVSEMITERTRPEELLLANMREVSRLCKAHGVPIASHDDDSAEKAALMAELGAVIAEFPVTLDAAQEAVRRGMMTAMGAPNAMRGKSYSGNLSAREAHAGGLLSILAADYHPAAILPALNALASADPEGIVGAVRLATANPAKALNLADRGEISVGRLADLVVIDAQDRIAMTLRGGEVIYSNGMLERDGDVFAIR